MAKAKSRSKPKPRSRVKKANSPARVTELLIHGGSTESRPSRKQNHIDDVRPPTWPAERTSSNGTQYEYQRIRNPYVPGEREKMLKKREKLTLEAFRIAYEDHHRRKAS